MIRFPVFVALYKKGGYTGWLNVRTLLMNMSTFRSQSNSTKQENTFVYDGARLILARNGPRTPGPRALAWFLTYSHIFASMSHQNKLFTYIETPSSILSSYVHFILLCRCKDEDPTPFKRQYLVIFVYVCFTLLLTSYCRIYAITAYLSV